MGGRGGGGAPHVVLGQTLHQSRPPQLSAHPPTTAGHAAVQLHPRIAALVALAGGSFGQALVTPPPRAARLSAACDDHVRFTVHGSSIFRQIEEALAKTFSKSFRGDTPSMEACDNVATRQVAALLLLASHRTS